ncbi:V-type proton ATPase subunit D 1 [Eumeta japonica]|uniref:V-type proton ATPase subunit D 1 n=1 Tax=Eumeta variegata TaxID=151549 RepID=A0A4C1SZN0_EUMVA|nr:V-type proton ATPase subunit D 1 [Eumeta japonica]
MNKDNCYQVTASLFMLREIKRRQEQVNRGYQLLKRKSEALRITGRQLSSELSTTHAILDTLRISHYRLYCCVWDCIGCSQEGSHLQEIQSDSFVICTIQTTKLRPRSGNATLTSMRSFSVSRERTMTTSSVQRRLRENISGVAIVSLQPVEESGAGDALQYAGLAAGGHRTGEAKKAFREAVRILIKFASLRNTCIVLNEAIRSTLRFLYSQLYIYIKLQEREEFHRLKLVKGKKVRAQMLQNLRMENGGTVKPENSDSYYKIVTERAHAYGALNGPFVILLIA